MVGRTDFDTAAALRHLPSVGGGLNPNLEAVLALAPDLVIRFGGESDPATRGHLDRMGIPYLTIRPDGIRDVRAIIRDLGTLTGHREEADTLLTRMDTALAEIRDRVEGRPRLQVAYLLGGSPPWVAAGGSYIEELLELAGGRNVFADLDGRFGPVNVELFLDRDIDLILASEGVEISIPGTETPVRRVSPGVEIPGPDLADAALEFARAIHPEAFR
jgi:iron complex transport system substrate-binding protein